MRQWEKIQKMLPWKNRCVCKPDAILCHPEAICHTGVRRSKGHIYTLENGPSREPVHTENCTNVDGFRSGL